MLPRLCPKPTQTRDTSPRPGSKGHIKALNLCALIPMWRGVLGGVIMHRASFAFGGANFRGTRPISLDGSSARSFERHCLRQQASAGADLFRRLALGLYVIGLIVILPALATGIRTLSASVLVVLAATLGDI